MDCTPYPVRDGRDEGPVKCDVVISNFGCEVLVRLFAGIGDGIRTIESRQAL